MAQLSAHAEVPGSFSSFAVRVRYMIMRPLGACSSPVTQPLAAARHDLLSAASGSSGRMLGCTWRAAAILDWPCQLS